MAVSLWLVGLVPLGNEVTSANAFFDAVAFAARGVVDEDWRAAWAMTGTCLEDVDMLEVRSAAFDDDKGSLGEWCAAVVLDAHCNSWVEERPELLVDADFEEEGAEDVKALSTTFEDSLDVDTIDVELVVVDVELNPNPAAI